MNNLPISVSQLIEELHNKNNPQHIRYNYMTTLESIKNAVTTALNKHYKDMKFK